MNFTDSLSILRSLVKFVQWYSGFLINSLNFPTFQVFPLNFPEHIKPKLALLTGLNVFELLSFGLSPCEKPNAKLYELDCLSETDVCNIYFTGYFGICKSVMHLKVE